MENLKSLLKSLPALLLLSGCSRQPTEQWPKPVEAPPLSSQKQPVIETETKAQPATVQATASAIVPLQQPATVTPAAENSSADSPSTIAAVPVSTPVVLEDEDAPKPPRELVKLYLATNDPYARQDYLSDIIDSDNPDVVKALIQLIPIEKDPDNKLTMLQALQDLDGDPMEKLAVFTAAASPSMPLLIREAAMDGVDILNDPRTIPFWQRLLADPIEDIRERAQDTIATLKRLYPNGTKPGVTSPQPAAPAAPGK